MTGSIEAASTARPVGAASEGWSQIVQTALEAHPTAKHTVLAIELDENHQGWRRTVEDVSRGLLESFAEDIGRPAHPITVVVRVKAELSPVGEAAWQAVRGIVGTAALEGAERGQRINTILTSARTTDADLGRALGYLGDDDAAGFTAGATVDLRNTPAGPDAQNRTDTGLPILLTGGAGGLGFATAQHLVERGRSVVLTDLAGAELDTAGRVLGVPTRPCDVRSTEQVAALARDPLFADGISGLLIYHGVGGSGRIVDLDPRERDRSIEVNGTAVDTVVDAFTRALGRGGPGIAIVLASQAGLAAEPGNAAYCAAKFATVGLVTGLARVWDPVDLRIHALCPGPIDTPLMRGAFAGMAASMGLTFEEYLEARRRDVPLGTFGEPGHIAAATELLLHLDATGTIVAPTGAAVLT